MPQIWVLIVLLIAIINVVSKASQKKQQKTDQANRPSQQTAQAKPRPLVKAEREEEDCPAERLSRRLIHIMKYWICAAGRTTRAFIPAR